MDSELLREKSLIDSFEQTEINLLVELRMGNGLRDEEYDKLVEILTVLARMWEVRDSIPKKAIGTLVELYAELFHFSMLYGKKESLRILEAAKNIKMLVQQCTKVSGEVEQEQSKKFSKLLQYINEEGNFFEEIQSGKGLHEQQFEKIYHEVKAVYNQIYDSESFPKLFVTTLIELYEMDLFVYQYEEMFDQTEEEEKIYEAHERIAAFLYG